MPQPDKATFRGDLFCQRKKIAGAFRVETTPTESAVRHGRSIRSRLMSWSRLMAHIDGGDVQAVYNAAAQAMAKFGRAAARVLLGDDGTTLQSPVQTIRNLPQRGRAGGSRKCDPVNAGKIN